MTIKIETTHSGFSWARCGGASVLVHDKWDTEPDRLSQALTEANTLIAEYTELAHYIQAQIDERNSAA